MELTSKQRAHLRGLAHHLDPVVLVGSAGVTDAVVEKVKVELEHHELIKVRVGEEDVAEAAAALAERAGAAVAGTIGKIAILYRRRKEKPEIVLPK